MNNRPQTSSLVKKAMKWLAVAYALLCSITLLYTNSIVVSAANPHLRWISRNQWQPRNFDAIETPLIQSVLCFWPVVAGC